MLSSPAFLSACIIRLALCFFFFAAMSAISSCGSLMPMNSEELNESWQEIRNQAFKFDKEGDRQKAEECYQKAILEAEKFGPKDSRLGSSYSELADFYAGQNNYDKAVDNYQKALAIYEPAISLAPGVSKPSVDNLLLAGTIITNKSRLAKIFVFQKKYPQAEKQYVAALEVAKQYPVPAQRLQLVVSSYCALLCELNREKDAQKIGEVWGQIEAVPQSQD